MQRGGDPVVDFVVKGLKGNSSPRDFQLWVGSYSYLLLLPYYLALPSIFHTMLIRTPCKIFPPKSFQTPPLHLAK